MANSIQNHDPMARTASVVRALSLAAIIVAGVALAGAAAWLLHLNYEALRTLGTHGFS